MSTGVLSKREREIAEAYARGESYHQVADQLGISPATVRTHLATIYRKLEVSSKIELFRALQGASPPARSTEEQAALITELALSLEEAISRERAVGQVLEIISRSDGQLDEVLSAVLRYALQLCDAEFGILFEFRPESGFRASHSHRIPGPFHDWLSDQGWFHVGPQTGLGRITVAKKVVNIIDVKSEEVYLSGDPLRYATADLGGARSFTAIPMLAKDELIGAFTIYRQTVRPFDDKSLELAKMFASQSVIAIENARLFDHRKP